MRSGRLRLREVRFPAPTIFMVGVLIGIIFFRIEKSMMSESNGLLDEATLYGMKHMSVDNSALFCFVLKRRLKSIFLFGIFSSTYLGGIASVLFVLWYGVGAGAFVAVALYRYGIKGILLVLAGIVPQFLVYVPAFLMLFGWCQSLYRGIYLEKKPEIGWMRLLKFLEIIGLVVIGCVMEAFWNPAILQGFLGLFYV